MSKKMMLEHLTLLRISSSKASPAMNSMLPTPNFLAFFLAAAIFSLSMSTAMTFLHSLAKANAWKPAPQPMSAITSHLSLLARCLATSNGVANLIYSLLSLSFSQPSTFFFALDLDMRVGRKGLFKNIRKHKF
ncbi:MAG: hypothetical protein ABIB71_01915 [Candidatus Woesearchaeota archaeon]